VVPAAPGTDRRRASPGGVKSCTLRAIVGTRFATPAAVTSTLIRGCAAAIVLGASVALAQDGDTRPKFADYQIFEQHAQAYWSAISEKRKNRFAKRRNHQQIVLQDYVLTQPPVYTGPPRPPIPQPDAPPRRAIPVVADFLQYAAEHFKFRPQRPASEIDFKRAYVKIAAAAGLTREQVVRIYGFEASGDGTHETQAGLERPRPNARAISTALGYNQLLTTNTVSLLAEEGDALVKAMRRKAAEAQGADRQRLEGKIAVLQHMIKVSRSVPVAWSEHEKLARTDPGIGMHALNLDIDIGPLLQTQKLLDSVVFARRKGHHALLSAAELEMMNLTGDGNGFDMVSMPLAMREQVPTSNFFQRSGYERNPVAIRNNVVSKLLAATDSRMDKEVLGQGARELAAAYDEVRGRSE
jgi:hypothetical protein